MGAKFTPTRAQQIIVETLHGYGLPLDQVRMHVINPGTGRPIAKTALLDNFRDELDVAQARANGKVLGVAFKIATDINHSKCAAMNMFWQKTRMGFKETERKEITGPDGGPIETITGEMPPKRAAELYAATIEQGE